jgi:2-amino-4-hydroxy-6-hydroxymethyldihydropteridine diphosphokinase
MALAYIGLGANLGDPQAQLRSALSRLDLEVDLRLIAQSRLYRSAPLGPPGQPDYCNAVCAVETTLAPLALLERLQSIEADCGRTRAGPRWGARMLDLDLLMYDALSLDTPRLKLPHPELLKRNFVLAPLAEIAGDLELPGAGRIADCAHRAGNQGLSLWAVTSG